MSQLKLEVGTTPSTPASGFTSLYPKTVSGASILFFKSDDGTEYNLAAGGAVTSVFGRIGVVTAQSGDYNSDQVTEGTSNLYYTSSRFNSDFATKTTTDLTEGTNLYYTDARARGAISATAPVSYNNSTGVISMAAATSLVNGYLTSSDWSTFNAKEPAILVGTSLQYWRGDKTFQTLDTAAVPENTNLYFTNTRAISATLTGYTSGAGTITSSDSILSAIQKLNGNTAALVTGVSSVFGRAGAVTAQSGDYTTAQVTESGNLYYTDARARAAVSATAPISYNSGSGVFSIHVADSTHDGYLTQTDWSTFNGKESVLTFSTGLTRTVNTVTVNTTQNIAKLSNLTTNGFVKTTSGDGTLAVDTNTYVNRAGDVLTGPVEQSAQTVSYSATVSPTATSFFIDITLTGNIVINGPSSPTANQLVWFRLLQDGTGGRTVTWSTGAGNFLFTSDIQSTDFTTSGTANALDQFGFCYNSGKGKWIAMARNRGAV